MSIREVSANKDGSLRIDLVPEILKGVFLASSPLELEDTTLQSEGSTMVKYLDLDQRFETASPKLLTVNIDQINASSLGLLFRTDEDLRGYTFRCVSTGDGKYTATLAITPPPLDDFWADQYKLYLHREVDGQDLVRHENVKLDGLITVLLVRDTLEIFIGGRAMSYRMESLAEGAHELGIFVDDGTAHFSKMTMRKVDT